jgi:hypothetical protein
MSSRSTSLNSKIQSEECMIITEPVPNPYISQCDSLENTALILKKVLEIIEDSMIKSNPPTKNDNVSWFRKIVIPKNVQ